MTHPILVGRINGLFGTRGWVKVFSYTRPRDNLLIYNPWYVLNTGTWQRYDVRDARRHHGGIVALLAGIDDRDQAALLLRREVAVDRSQLSTPAGDEYYWSDLIGLRVVNLQQQELGRVTGLLETGAHDVLRVVGASEHLIPFVRGVYITAIDLAGAQIRVDWHSDD